MVKLRIENNGQVVDISNNLPVGFLRGPGLAGLGIAPTTLTIREGAAEGGRWRRTKRGVREIDLPLTMLGETEEDVRDLMRQFVRVINDKYSAPKMYVTYPDGTELFTEVHYAGGANHQYGDTTDGQHWAKWGLTLRSPSPYWTDTNATSYSLTTANTGRGLIRGTGTSLTELRLSSSAAIGNLNVENPGDVDAYPVWTVRGPGTNFTASVNGVGFAYNATITNGNPITIDTEQKTVVDSTGVNMYANLGASPKLFSLPPGRSTVAIVMTGADATSLVQLSFRPRYEVVF